MEHEFMVEDLVWPILWLILLPMMWLVSTPVILIAAGFGPTPYWSRAVEMYAAVTRCWFDLI